MRTWLAAIGLFSMLGQVVILRELNVAFYGSELIYILALGLWMVFTGAGAALTRWEPSPARVRALLCALALVTPALIALTRCLRWMLSDVPGAYLSFPTQVGAMLVVLAPIAALLGISFQWAARLYARTGRTVAEAYAIESAGGLAGGALATLMLLAGLANLALGLLASLALCATAALPWRQRPRWLPGVVAPTAALLVAALATSSYLDEQLTRLNHPDLAASRDTPYGRVTVTASGGQAAVFENDALAFDTHTTSAEELTHLAAVQRPYARRVLIVGGSVEGLAAAALEHRPESVEVIEINSALLELARAHLSSDALDDERVQVTIADPRAFLRDAQQRYDLILIGAPEPASGVSNRYYTREMFALAATRLSQRGILAFRLASDDNLLGAHHRRRLASIHRALRSELADSVILPGTSHLFLASPTPLERDPDLLARRFEALGIEARLVSGAYITYLYENDRYAELALAASDTRVQPNRDAYPICYQHTLMIWLSKFYPAVALLELDPSALPAAVWILLVAAFAGALLGLRRWPRAQIAARVGVAGFVGMLLETTVILAFQSGRGALFGDLGLLLTAFMAGLTAAAFAVARLRTVPRRASVILGAILVLSSALVGVAVLHTDVGLPLASLLLFVAGAAVAAVFAHATRTVPHPAAAVGPLYAADLAGGALASVLASLILIPWLGLGGVSFLALSMGLGVTILTGK